MEGRNIKESFTHLINIITHEFRLPARRVILLLLAFAVLAITFLTFLPIVDKPFSLDEAEESLIGWKMITLGSRALMPVGNLPVSHPLLYSITHSLLQRIFGPGELPLRLYGVFHFLLSGALLLMIIAQVFEKEFFLKKWGMFFGAALYLLNPLLIQHSVVINADNNILTTAILLFVYFFLRFEKLEGSQFRVSRIKLAILLALCFWSKEMAPIFLIAGVLTYRIFCRAWKRLKLDLFYTAIGGIAIFCLTWWLYCFLTGTDVFGFIKYTMVGKSRQAFAPGYLSSSWKVFFSGLRWHIYWVSAPFFICLFFFVIDRSKSLIKKQAPEIIDFIFIVALAIWLPFQAFRPQIDMMKYQYPAYPLLVVVISWLFVKMSGKRIESGGQEIFCTRNLLLFAVISSLFAFHYFMIGDYLLAIWEPLFKHLNSHFYLYYYLPIFAVFFLILIGSRKSLLFANLCIACAFFILPINIGLSINQAKAKYNTAEIYLNYGEAGLEETIKYLSAHVKPGSVIAVRQDLEYYLVERYGIKINTNITPDKFFLGENEDVVKFVLSQAPIDYLVVDKVSAWRVYSYTRFVLINKYFSLERRFGDFYIFKKKNS